MPTPAETEEFEFRARAEKEAAVPRGTNSTQQPPMVDSYGRPWKDDIVQQAGRWLRDQVGRPVAEGLTGVATAIPNIATEAANLLPQKIGPVDLGPKQQSPGDYVQQHVIDRYTNAPTTTMGKVADFVDSTIAGSVAGPRLPGSTPAPRTLTPRAQQAKTLADKGVVSTPGQIQGGWLDRLEQGAQSMPIIGDFIKNARNRSVEQFHQATINDALKPIGAQLPKDLKGNQAIAEAERLLSEKYDAILPQLKGNLGGLKSELDQLKINGQSLPAQQATDLARIIDKEIVDKFKNGQADGRALKDIRTTLNNEIKEFQNSTSPYDRKLAQALGEARDALQRMVTRENPQYSKELSKIDEGWSKFKVAQRAAVAARKDGVFTPAQYLSSVAAKDVSKDKSAFARGTARQQSLGQAGSDVLGNTLPDSGTPFRLGEQNLLTPKGLARLGIGAPLAGSLYNQPVLKMVQDRLLSEQTDPKVRAALSRLLIWGGAQSQFGSQPNEMGVVQ